MRYLISLSFNGSAFSGWQIQKNAHSVQQELQESLSLLLGTEIKVTGAGRTDTGVNAVNYIAHFDCPECIENTSFLLYKINAILPRYIAVYSLEKTSDDFHSRFDAKSRTYKYFIHTFKDPFLCGFSLFVRKEDINIEKMNLAASFFMGEHDFTSFEKANGGNKTSICRVSEAFWERIPGTGYGPLDMPQQYGKNKERYVFTVTADRFLRNMVRAMVGSLLEVGKGKKDPDWIKRLLIEKDRCKAGQSVSGTALFLWNIKY
ncbi:MAG: tRNA pseudouridine(38-40) synthase TruA [Bacteroidales bacterium]|jgi:tRNA pseudouridine38-40 synthase|nr:tRNA pseudouridine(38-40) synthase TruA [Bacteroidales bacterium]